jgi:hypothetical protein
MSTANQDKNTLFRRSCIRCYKRKEKCNRHLPCVNCTSFGVTCTFPTNRIRRNCKTVPPPNEHRLGREASNDAAEASFEVLDGHEEETAGNAVSELSRAQFENTYLVAVRKFCNRL